MRRVIKHRWQFPSVVGGNKLLNYRCKAMQESEDVAASNKISETRMLAVMGFVGICKTRKKAHNSRRDQAPDCRPLSK